ncbi:MAG: hypothetical protein U0M15_00555 [Bacillota bacterium]|nr:hypothetical protein [Bacillota bacterium]
MKKILIVVAWVTLFVVLLVTAQNIPSIRHITEASETTYQHTTDEYCLDLEGLWQVSVDRLGELILLQADANASIVCNLEVGGYDYLSAEEIAEKVQTAFKADFEEAEFSQRIGETEATLHDTIYFTGTCQLEGETLSSEHYVIHPSEGIRLYVNYFYPADTDNSIVEQGRQIILSIRFPNTEAIYQKYLK